MGWPPKLTDRLRIYEKNCRITDETKPFHFSTKTFKFRRRHSEQTFNWFVLASAAISGAADDQTFVSEAVYAVAVRPRFSPPFGRLRNVVRGGRVRLPLFQPELVHGAQERREDHRAPAGGCLCHQLFGDPFAIRTKRAGAGVISRPCDRSLQQAGSRQFR